MPARRWWGTCCWSEPGSEVFFFFFFFFFLPRACPCASYTAIVHRTIIVAVKNLKLSAAHFGGSPYREATSCSPSTAEVRPSEVLGANGRLAAEIGVEASTRLGQDQDHVQAHSRRGAYRRRLPRGEQSQEARPERQTNVYCSVNELRQAEGGPLLDTNLRGGVESGAERRRPATAPQFRVAMMSD